MGGRSSPFSDLVWWRMQVSIVFEKLLWCWGKWRGGMRGARWDLGRQIQPAADRPGIVCERVMQRLDVQPLVGL